MMAQKKVLPAPVRPTTKKQFREASKEEWVMSVLQGQYPNMEVMKASRYEDCTWDIDCYLGEFPISIKRQDKALSTGNISFELEVLVSLSKRQLGGTERTIHCADWQLSTFHTSRASSYMVVVGEVIYSVNVKRLKRYVSDHGWHKVVTNSHKVRDEQDHIGHTHIDGRSGLIPISVLLKEKVAKKIYT